MLLSAHYLSSYKTKNILEEHILKYIWTSKFHFFLYCGLSTWHNNRKKADSTMSFKMNYPCKRKAIIQNIFSIPTKVEYLWIFSPRLPRQQIMRLLYNTNYWFSVGCESTNMGKVVRFVTKWLNIVQLHFF